jgi:hypothetical protein
MQLNDNIINILSWSAVALLSVSYWFQIWKIHVHKEVRDLSMTYHVFLALGFGILTFTAWKENSTVFLVKQISTTIPVIIIIIQIYVHKSDHWQDDGEAFPCLSCDGDLEYSWNHCAHCGVAITAEQKISCKSLEYQKMTTEKSA